MKKALLVCVLGASLFSCSLLQRRGGGTEEGAEVHDTEASQDGPLFTPTGQEISSGAESEVARLNTKISALETKLDVLTANMERLQAQRAQPVIEAKPQPQPNLASPVDDIKEIQEQTNATQISAAPVKPTKLPTATKSSESELHVKVTAVEKEFRAGMQLFQNGQNLEAASRFALLAQKYPGHLLASHALYWAGESSARGQQLALAIDNWSELERRYPRSAYLSDALAGMAKAYEAQGDSAKAKYYRSLLMKAFPKSPVALREENGLNDRVAAKDLHRTNTAAESVSSDEESIPVFEESSQEQPEESR